ncbi:MAG: phospho-N-acetylmuramoyl-pentapeptide-transferase [Treponema sp.]|nr:phospho-N-acetylmuramoyl-pentapeptide-transferase [Treponema sp.]
MFYEFVYPLVRYFTPFNVFQYLSFRGAYAAITTLFLCYIFGPRVIEALRRLKVGQVVREELPGHSSKAGTPTMGGIFVIISILISMFLWTDFRSPMIWITLGSFVAFGFVGFLDDYLKITKKSSGGLSPKKKLIGQFLISLAVMLFLYFTGNEEISVIYIPFFKDPVINLGFLWIPFGILLIMGTSNAVNFGDGLDGLLAGLLIFAFVTLAILAYLSGHAEFSSYLGIPFISGAGELMIFCVAVTGACVGFLWFNSHPAEVFIGDVGSLSLGGVMAVIALIIKKEILLFIIGGVFVIEIVSVIIQVTSFKKRGKRVFLKTPIHHHFEELGWAESKIVTRFWILGGLFAVIALSTLKIQ